MQSVESTRTLWQEIKRFAHILLGIVAVLWGVLLVDTILGGELGQFGILPRTMIGLRGILFAPFLHSSVAHLTANTVGFLLLGGLVLLREEEDFWSVTFIGALVGGFALWLFGRPATMHIGASGVIFSYFGYLISTGFFDRRFGSIALSTAAVFLWGSLVFGILPGQPGISWEGHLFGLLSGVLAAWLLSRVGSRRRLKPL